VKRIKTAKEGKLSAAVFVLCIALPLERKVAHQQPDEVVELAAFPRKEERMQTVPEEKRKLSPRRLTLIIALSVLIAALLLFAFLRALFRVSAFSARE